MTVAIPSLPFSGCRGTRAPKKASIDLCILVNQHALRCNGVRERRPHLTRCRTKTMENSLVRLRHGGASIRHGNYSTARRCEMPAGNLVTVTNYYIPLASRYVLPSSSRPVKDITDRPTELPRPSRSLVDTYFSVTLLVPFRRVIMASSLLSPPPPFKTRQCRSRITNPPLPTLPPSPCIPSSSGRRRQARLPSVGPLTCHRFLMPSHLRNG